MSQCTYYIKRKRRLCTHFVTSANESSLCTMHLEDSLLESRLVDQIARDKHECRLVLDFILNEIEKAFHDHKSAGRRHAEAKRRQRKKRISAPGRMANPFSIRLTPKVTSSFFDWKRIYLNCLSRPMHVDVGCARGRFLERIASRPHRQEWNHLGIEIRPEVVRESIDRLTSLRKLDAMKYSNLHYSAFNFAASAEDFFLSLPAHTVRMISFQVRTLLMKRIKN